MNLSANRLCSVAFMTASLYSSQPTDAVATVFSTAELIQEIDQRLFIQSNDFLGAAKAHHALYAANKALHVLKKRLPLRLIEQLANTSALHPLLTQAYMLDRNDWIAKRIQERDQAPQVRLLTESGTMLVPDNKTINLIDGTLAALIRESYRAFLLDQHPRARAIYDYLQTTYAQIQYETPGFFKQNGTYCGLDIFKGRNVYQVNDCPCTFGDGYASFSKRHKEMYITAMGPKEPMFKCKDLLFLNNYYVLISSTHIPESIIFRCISAQDLYESLDTCLTQKPADYHFPEEFDGQFEREEPMPFTDVHVFDGRAKTLAFDPATSKLKAYDAQGTLLYSYTIDPHATKERIEPDDN